MSETLRAPHKIDAIIRYTYMAWNFVVNFLPSPVKAFLPQFDFERLVAECSGSASASGDAFLEAVRAELQRILDGAPEHVAKMARDHAKKAGDILRLLGREGAEIYVSHGILPSVRDELEARQRNKSQESKLQGKIDQVVKLQQRCQEELLQSLHKVQSSEVGVSAKANSLIRRLQELLLLEEGPKRCIVFVAEVAPTYPLAELLNRRVKPGVLPISGRSSMSDTMREKNLRKFREGEEGAWCLVATNSIEEGIDIPDCNVVVRFDKFHNVKSHVQGTGRCRGAGKGGLIIYFENDPDVEQQQADLVQQVAQQGAQEPVARACQPDPQGCVDPATGAEIDEINCLSILNDYVCRASSGAMGLEDAFKPSSSHIIECVAPSEDGDLKVSVQDVQRYKEVAQWPHKQRFAFAMLQELRRLGLLSEQNLPLCRPSARENPEATPGASLRRHLRFNPKTLQSLQERLEKGLQSSNSKGALKECVDLLLGKPCGRDDIVYQEVKVVEGVQCQACVQLLSQKMCFGPGASCSKKPEAGPKSAYLPEFETNC